MYCLSILYPLHELQPVHIRPGVWQEGHTRYLKACSAETFHVVLRTMTWLCTRAGRRYIVITAIRRGQRFSSNCMALKETVHHDRLYSPVIFCDCLSNFRTTFASKNFQNWLATISYPTSHAHWPQSQILRSRLREKSGWRKMDE